MKIAVVMPTMRDARSLPNFIEIAPTNVDFVVITREPLTKNFERTCVFYDKHVFSRSWIFNRITKRSYGFLYAYEQKYDVIISLDDDCYPINSLRPGTSVRNFFQAHLMALSEVLPKFYNVLELISNLPSDVVAEGPRGFPRHVKEIPKAPVVLNQGLWFNDIDLDATTLKKLKSIDGKYPLKHEFSQMRHSIIPFGQFVTVCGMNMAFRREVIPCFYQIYMEPDKEPFINRHEDIWAGLFLKRVLDHLDKSMSAGYPPVWHSKAPRDVSKDLMYQSNGRELNDYFWQTVPKIPLDGKDYEECYQSLARELRHTASVSNMSAISKKFLYRICDAMEEWMRLVHQGL